MNPTRRRLLLGLAALVPTAALLPRSLLAEGPGPLDTVTLVLHSEQGPHRLRVEVARTLPQRGQGLRDRDHLDAEAGMLFLYRDEQSPRNGFWMYRTRIPLDIAFIDADGRIVAIRQMQPCDSERPGECPVTYPGVPYRAALEVNAGYFAEQGVAEGDCVSWPGSGSQCLVDVTEDPA
ncbi:DUF192 domain-containing protein [Halomonas sp. LBP4]|uniref:DUF192 domain-containing protein n=1 Tax=Halomonas sp. LBP4 TaxID=2044917 RepID=UPI000D7511F2|nr:DUF192 domain-containing protein [Halomonas sp. LBP4]PXY00051.1 hypothetical protein CR157_04655 [Halomonas sp. LBP4]